MGIRKFWKKLFRRMKDFLPVIDGRRVHFTKEALIFVLVVAAALLTAAYILGFRLGEWLSSLP